METELHLRKPSLSKTHLGVPFPGTRVILGAGWLVMIPAGLWALATFGIAILGAFLTPLEAWAAALLAGALIAVSLFAHTLAHVWVARLTRSRVPAGVSLYPFGEAAQVWPAAASPAREVLVSMAGPAANLLLAGLAYLGWNAQPGTYLNIVLPIWGLYNAALVIANLAPVFPLDGGRLLRAITWGLLGRPALASRLSMRLGWLACACLGLWGIALLLGGGRFGVETALVTLSGAAILVLGLRSGPAWTWDRPEPGLRGGRFGSLARLFVAGACAAILMLAAASLIPMNAGLEAPGVALAVEPMVVVPPAHFYPSAGSLILTSVIEQVPITVGAWVAGQVSPSIRIVSPDELVPPDTTLQEQARRGFKMLDESVMLASVEGLRLAGYQVNAEGKGAEVIAILAGSPSRDVLRPGDVIVGVNGKSIQTTSGLVKMIASLPPDSAVQLQVRRDGRELSLSDSLMRPARAGDPPRLGISVGSAGLDVRLPFPVQIKPQKIVGGPSAGLMFTLAVYDAVTPGDLTGGHKIAGTGTIDIGGAVGPIGGVAEKVVAAESTGAEYFLSPPENYADARAAAHHIKVVEIDNAQQAIDFLRSLPPASEASAT